jgi:hypothetical protein
MASRKSTKNTNDPLLYQVKITLKDIRPPIWRRIEVYSL